MDHSYAIIMAGGAGTRLWPISRQKRPKQFQAFTHELTLLQHMVKLTSQVIAPENILVMATPEFADIIRQQLPELPTQNLLFEPARRDNGPAIAIAMLQAHLRDPEATVALLWSDHDIREPEVFAKTLETCLAASKQSPSSLVMMGAKPTHPDTGLGYIQIGKEIANYNDIPVFKVKAFAEKPDLVTATRYVSSWEYLWNVGSKIMKASEYLTAFRQIHPELESTLDTITEACKEMDQDKIRAHYDEFPKLSDEYLFTNHIKDLLVVPADIGWSDVGNWKTLFDVLKDRYSEQLVIKGEVISLDSKNSLIFAKDRPIAVVGINNLVVVDDGDVILVMNKDKASRIKELTQQLENNKPELL